MLDDTNCHCGGAVIIDKIARGTNQRFGVIGLQLLFPASGTVLEVNVI